MSQAGPGDVYRYTVWWSCAARLDDELAGGGTLSLASRRWIAEQKGRRAALDPTQQAETDRLAALHTGYVARASDPRGPMRQSGNRARQAYAAGDAVRAAAAQLAHRGLPAGMRRTLEVRVRHPDLSHRELGDLRGIRRESYNTSLRRALEWRPPPP